MKAWSGKSHGDFFFPPSPLFRGVLEVSVPSRRQSRNKGCVWFQVGYGQPEPITLEQQGLPLLQLSLLGKSRARKQPERRGERLEEL